MQHTLFIYIIRRGSIGYSPLVKKSKASKISSLFTSAKTTSFTPLSRGKETLHSKERCEYRAS